MGVAGNERADLAARSAHHSQTPTMEVFAVPTNIYPCVDRVAHQEHLTWYSSLPRSYLSSVSPSVSPLLDIRISLSRFHVAVHRIRCNFCVTPSYLFTLNSFPLPTVQLVMSLATSPTFSVTVRDLTRSDLSSFKTLQRILRNLFQFVFSRQTLLFLKQHFFTSFCFPPVSCGPFNLI